MPFAPTTTMGQDDILSKDKINTFILGPLSDLVSPASSIYHRSVGDATLSTVSTTYAAVDDTLGIFYLQITTKGNPVSLDFRAVVSNSTANAVNSFDVEIDGTLFAIGGNGMWIATHASVSGSLAAMLHELIPLGAGVHDFKLRWKVSSGTLTMSSASRPFFAVREI